MCLLPTVSLMLRRRKAYLVLLSIKHAVPGPCLPFQRQRCHRQTVKPLYFLPKNSLSLNMVESASGIGIEYVDKLYQ
jgi:hypothetical protein